MGLRGTSRHRVLVPLLSLTVMLVAAACTRGYGTDRERIPPSALGRVGRPTIVWPPPTVPAPVTTVPALPRPEIIPGDAYAPEPVQEIGTIEIPALGLVHPIYQGVTLNNIDRGPSHWPGTADPGQPGNTVFAGHRITNSHPFLHLDDLVAGDEVIFTVGAVRSVYRVTGTMVVDPHDTWIATQTPEPTGTLYACHPPGSVAARFVVKLALAA